MLNRRRFLQSIVAAASTPAALQGCGLDSLRRMRADSLEPDPVRILDLAAGLEYRIVSQFGHPMSDGLRVPGAHDGMAAFPGTTLAMTGDWQQFSRV